MGTLKNASLSARAGGGLPEAVASWSQQRRVARGGARRVDPRTCRRPERSGTSLGHEPGSMTRSAAEITESLGGRRAGAGWLARCPVHEDTRPSLSIRDSPEGRLLVHCFAGCQQREIIAVLRERGLWGPATTNQDEERRIELRVRPSSGRDHVQIEILRQIAIRIWHASKPGAGTLAETYLRSRGITMPVPASVRFLER